MAQGLNAAVLLARTIKAGAGRARWLERGGRVT